MASPLQTGKQTVNLAAPIVRGSRIRREPPPPRTERTTVVPDRDERDQMTVTVGIAGFSNVSAWSPSEHELHIRIE